MRPLWPVASPEERVNTVLRASTALAALVGTRIRVAPLSPTDALPAISFQRISSVRESAHGSDTGHVRSRLQVNAWGTTFSSAHSVAELVRGLLQRYRASTDVVDIFLANSRHQYDAANEIHGFQQDFTIHHKE